jgi:hypothetical protein
MLSEDITIHTDKQMLMMIYMLTMIERELTTN